MSEIGLRVGPFEIVEAVEAPEAGRWFVGRRGGLRQPTEVLLKLPGEGGEPDAAALHAEFARLRALDDRRVPTVVGFYEGAGALAVHRVHGIPLANLLGEPDGERMALGATTWLDVVVDVAETVQHAHHRGMVHGHLDGHQLWIAPDGRLWLWGFGPGPQIDPDPAWLPPERAQRLAPTAATDQWSLAALLAAALTGRPPWSHTDPLAQARSGSVESWLQPLAPAWPGLVRTLRKMLDPTPGHRYPTVQAARQELLAQCRAIGGVAQRRALGAWVARLSGVDVLPPSPSPEELLDEDLAVVRPELPAGFAIPHQEGEDDADDEATVLVEPGRLRADIAALRAARRSAQSTDPGFGRAESTWPGLENVPAERERPPDLERTMLFSDHPDHEPDTDPNKPIEAVILADDDEDSIAQTLDASAVPAGGEIREPEGAGPPPLDIPIDDPTAEKVDLPLVHDEEDTSPYHNAIDLAEIDTAPNESLEGGSPLPLPPREMSLSEKVASALLATLAGLMLIWFLVQVV